LDTGNPSDADVHCMAIAHHLKMANGADTRFMTNGTFSFDPKTKWPNYMAYLELRKNPKFHHSPSAAVTKVANNNQPNVSNMSVPQFIQETLVETSVSDVSSQEKDNFVETVPSEVISIEATSQLPDGQRKAKHQLKQQLQQEKDKVAKSENLIKVSDALTSLATSHAEMVKNMKDEHVHKKIKY
jgi:hypothetical protein